MAAFQYRAVTAAGEVATGRIEAASADDVVQRLRQQGLRPIEAVPARGKAAEKSAGRVARTVVIKVLAELAVLLEAGLAIDRALVIAIDNVEQPATRQVFTRLLDRIREGVSLAQAVGEAGGSFPPMAAPMIAAGEASGAVGAALTKLADTLERGEALRQTVISASIYPAMLLIIALAVTVMILIGVIPQFETMFAGNEGKLPAATLVVLAMSRGLRENGLLLLLGLALAVVAARFVVTRPAVRRQIDRRMLTLPLIGPLVVRLQTGRFARVLGSLVTGGVPLPSALALAQATLTNAHMAAAVARIVVGLKEGAGLSGPLGATGIFPRVALSFMRTGEETAQLGPMLDRLANVLEGEARIRIARLASLITPIITVLMGVIIGSLIASIMSAILGFNDLALEQ